MRTVNNHKQLLIGKTNPTSTVTPLPNYNDASNLGTIATPATLADGEIVITREDGAIVEAGVTSNIYLLDRVYVVQGQGADKPLIKSALIPFNSDSISFTFSITFSSTNL